MKQGVIMVMLSALLLSGCGGKPTPDIEATVQAAVVATLTALPTDTPRPTPTPAPTTAPTPTPAPTHTPRPTDIPVPDTPTPTATPTPEPTPTPTPLIHVVQPGETLSGIAIEYGVPLEALLAANDIDNPRQTRSGRALVIPVSDTAAAEEEPTQESAPAPADTPSGTEVAQAEPETAGTPTAPDTASDTPPEEPEPAGTDIATAPGAAPQALPDENVALVIETALRLDETVVVKDVSIVREPDRQTILVVIESQGGTGSMADETTLIEAATSFIYSYAADQQLGIQADYVLVQAQNGAGGDSWYAAATMGDIGLLTLSEITLAEFLDRIRIETPS